MARRFYEKHGFALIKETDGSGNEEKEPCAVHVAIYDLIQVSPACGPLLATCAVHKVGRLVLLSLRALDWKGSRRNDSQVGGDTEERGR